MKSIVASTVLAVAVVSGCGKPGESEAKEGGSEAKPVHAEAVARSTIEEVLVYTVDLEPGMEVKIYSMLSETILDFPWEDGDRIDKGKRVALIRKKGLTKSMAQVAAQLEGLDVQIGTVGDQLERSKALAQNGVMSQSEFDQIEGSYLSLKAQKKAMIASKGQLADQVGKASIVAPISGVIADRAYEVGDLVSPAMPLCRILQMDRLKASLDLVEEDVPKVHVGQEVHFTLDAYPGRTFDGEITSILPYLNPMTRTNTIEVTIENPLDGETDGWLLKPGMYGVAEIVVARHENAVVVPGYALLMDDALLDQQKPGQILRRAFVVDEEGSARERIVEIGIRQGKYYEVLSGLEKGEMLVVRGQHGLVDGLKVRIVKAAQ